MEKIVITALLILLAVLIGRDYIFGDGDKSLKTNTDNIMTTVTQEIDSLTTMGN